MRKQNLKKMKTNKKIILRGCDTTGVLFPRRDC